MNLFNSLYQFFFKFFKFFTSEPTIEHILCKSSRSFQKSNFTKSKSTSKVFTYPCLKTVYGYLDANKRIELSQRCPPFRSMDKQIPLKIRYLSVNPYGLKIYSHSYYLKVVNIKETKETGAQLSFRELKNIHYEHGTILSPNPADNFIRFRRDDWCDPGVSSHIEWIAFPRRHKEALTFLYEKLLGNRNMPTKVNQLDITGVGDVVGNLGTLKFKTKKLEIDSKVACNLSTIIPNFDESCFPLSCLELIGMILNRSEEDKLDHPIIQSAKMIKINMSTNVLHRFSHLRVHVDWRYLWVTHRIILLIDYWLHNGKEVGTLFSFIMSTANAIDAVRFWEEVKTKYIDRVGEDQRAIRPFEPLIIPTRFFSTICFTLARGTGKEWTCNLEVRSV